MHSSMGRPGPFTGLMMVTVRPPLDDHLGALPDLFQHALDIA